jgi:hypothetical protein
MITILGVVLGLAAGWVGRSIHAKVPIVPFTIKSGGGPGEEDSGPK